jgi:acyl-CoA synthetase (AMP-forming)/AMP-acid ligase II
MVVRYANWFLELGVERDECVAFYLQNSAEFMFAWMGLLAINAHPAMVNYNLEGGGLVHCVRISKARIILIDDELRNRVLENEDLKSMGLNMIVLNDQLRDIIKGRAVEELPKNATDGSSELSTLALRYTRYDGRCGLVIAHVHQWNNWLPQGRKGSPRSSVPVCGRGQVLHFRNPTSTEW